MGKRNANLSGLARFVTEAFGSTSTTPPPPHANPKDVPLAGNAATLSEHGTTRRASEVMSDVGDDAAPPKKKRKVGGLLGPGKEQYDAMGLVPFYQEASQVPSHLQKCAYTSIQHNACLRLTVP